MIIYFSAAVITGLFFYHSDLQAVISIPVIYRVIPVPLLYWAPIMVFLIIGKRLNAVRDGHEIKRYILWAFFIHMLDMALGLTTVLHQEGMKINVIYQQYIKLFIFIFSLSCVVFSLCGDRKFKPLWVTIFLITLYHTVNNSFFYLAVFPVGYLIAGFFTIERMETCKQMCKSFYSNEKSFVLIVLSIALLVRLGFGFSLIYQLGDDYTRASDDGIGYLQYAETIISNFGLFLSEAPKFIWPPVYTWFLACLMILVGKNYLFFVIVNSFLGLITVLFGYLTAKKIFGREIASITIIIIALHQSLIFYSVVLGTEVLSIPFLSIYLYVLISSFENLNLKKLFLGGIFWGLACWTIQMHIFFYILFAPAALILWNASLLKKIKGLMVFTFGGSLIFGFIQINYFIQTGAYNFFATPWGVSGQVFSMSGLTVTKPDGKFSVKYYLDLTETMLKKELSASEWEEIRKIEINPDTNINDIEKRILNVNSHLLSNALLIKILSKRELFYQWIYLKRAVALNISKTIIYRIDYSHPLFEYRNSLLFKIIFKNLIQGNSYPSSYFELQYYGFKYQPIAWFTTNIQILLVRAKYFFFPSQFGYFDPLLMLNVARLNISKVSYWNTLEFYSLLLFVLGLVSATCKTWGPKVLFFLLTPLFFFMINAPSELTYQHMLRYSTPIRPVIITIVALGLLKSFEFLINEGHLARRKKLP